MKINSEVSKLARFGEDAIEGFNTAVENGQARLAMSILVDVINAFDEKFDDIDEKNGKNFNLLFQLPTGGGKTVIFSNIAKEYIERTKRKVLILTHRIELCIQTSKQLTSPS